MDDVTEGTKASTKKGRRKRSSHRVFVDFDKDMKVRARHSMRKVSRRKSRI
jgi:hypothetical protein